jgi:hypothetical protein
MLYEFLGKLFKSPASLFLKGLMLKWYILVMVPAVTAAYYFFSHLEKMGVLDKVYNFIEYQLGMIVRITQECTPKILDISAYISCLNYIN